MRDSSVTMNVRVRRGQNTEQQGATRKYLPYPAPGATEMYLPSELTRKAAGGEGASEETEERSSDSLMTDCEIPWFLLLEGLGGEFG